MDPGPPRKLRKALPAVILIGIIAAGLASGYYATVLAKRQDGVNWHINPIQVTFSATDSSGSARDSFQCHPDTGPVVLEAKSSNPGRIILSVSPSSFPTCGSPPDRVVVTASCASGVDQNGNTLGEDNCEGQFTGQVTVMGPTPLRESWRHPTGSDNRNLGLRLIT